MSLACAPIHSLRRTFFAVACTLVGSLASLNSFAWDLTILHANDVHSAAAGVNDRGPVYDDTNAVGGLARVTAFVADEKAKAKVQGKGVLALDAGDFWQGTHCFRTGGMPWAREAMRRMPWDAVTLGNHEFDLGCETLARYVKALPFPVLSANLEKNPACPLSTAPLPSTVVKDFDGVKVGIIGLANDEGKDISEACPETNFADRAAVLRRAAAELEKSGVTHIIAVTHVGYEADQALARAVPAIDVIVGGHTHSVLGNHPHSEGPYPTVIPHADGSQTLVVQAGRSTRYLGRLSVSFDDAGRIVQFKGDLEELVPSLRRDEAMHEFVERSLEAIRADQKRFVGVNSSTLPDGLDPCREGDCLSGMIHRIDPIVGGQPRAIFIMGGANDLIFSKISDAKLLEQYERLLDIIARRSPRTKVYVQSLLPLNESMNEKQFGGKNARIVSFNKCLREMAARRGLVFIDIWSAIQRDGILPEEMTFDGVHLKADGYRIWIEQIRPYMK